MTASGQERAMSNLEYDLTTALHEKSKAVKAYDTYIQDAQGMDSQPCVELFQKLKQQDTEHAQEIRRHLKEVMEKGKM